MKAYFSSISRIQGVTAFFIVDGKGNIRYRNFSSKMEAGEEKEISRTIAACGSIYLSISPRQFRYAAFLRQNSTQILIFPFGKHFLTVVAEAGGQHPGTDRIAKEILSIPPKGTYK